jgi:hypothetical protein
MQLGLYIQHITIISKILSFQNVINTKNANTIMHHKLFYQTNHTHCGLTRLDFLVML